MMSEDIAQYKIGSKETCESKEMITLTVHCRIVRQPYLWK